MAEAFTSTYPEHERMFAIADKSQVIGDFLDWLPTIGLRVCEPITHAPCTGMGFNWSCVDGRKVDDRTNEPRGLCPTCDGEGMVELTDPSFMPTGRGITSLLAEFFDIDLARIDTEKRAMLAALREREET